MSHKKHTKEQQQQQQQKTTTPKGWIKIEDPCPKCWTKLQLCVSEFLLDALKVFMLL